MVWFFFVSFFFFYYGRGGLRGWGGAGLREMFLEGSWASGADFHVNTVCL